MLCRMTTLTPRRLCVSAAAAAVLVAGAPRADGLAAVQGGEQLTVDFVAVSADGRPVADLRAEDISLRVGGRNRSVKSLRLVKFDGATGGGAPSAGLPAPFATNADGGGGAASRSILLVIEDESLRPGAERDLREHVGKFLDGLSPADRVALSTAPRDVVRVGFGAGTARVREALAQITGRMPASANESERTCRTRDTLIALRAQLAGLAGAETPTTVVVFSSAMTVASTGSNLGAGACDVNTEHYQSLGPATAAARANVYIVQQDPNVTQRNDGLENLAGVTSAGAVLRMASTTSPLARIAQETSAYYLATFDAEGSDRSGQNQRLELKVNRDGVTTRSRTEFFVARAAPAGAKPGAPITSRDMMRETRAFRDLPLRAAAFASRAPGDNKLAPVLGVIVMAEPIDPSVKIAQATAGLVDSSGKIVVQLTADEKQLQGRPIILSFPVSQGTYRLRVAAVDASGKTGAVDQELVAELTPAGPLKLGALVLTAFRNNSAVPALTFRGEEKIVGVLEMYGQVTAQVSARMELAETLNGPALEKIQPGGRQTSEPDKFILTGEIPIASLKPGDYVVRAFVNLEGQPEGKVIKTFRKVAK
jgi:hypothetical protein